MRKKIKNIEKETLQIRSIFLASYLYGKGHNFIKIEPDELGKAILFYSKNSNLLEDIRKFYSNSLLQNFINSYKIVKNKIYEELGSRKGEVNERNNEYDKDI